MVKIGHPAPLVVSLFVVSVRHTVLVGRPNQPVTAN